MTALPIAGPDQLRLVGRQPEIALLMRRIDESRAGATALTIVGRAGVGVSSMIAAAAQHGELTGFQVLATAAVPAEQATRFAGLHDLVRLALRKLPADRRAEHRSALALARTMSPIDVAERLGALLDEISRVAPVLLAVDDAHWLDRGSLETMALLCRRLGPTPVSVIIAARAGRLELPAVPVLEIPPLNRIDAEDLLDASGVELGRDLRARILDEANGSPLALTELPLACRALASTGIDVLARFLPMTARLQHSIGGELADLSDETVAALLAAALHLGDNTREILDAAGLIIGHDLAIQVLQPAADLGWLTVTDRVRFVDPLLRAATVEAASITELRDANAALEIVLAGHAHASAWHAAHATLQANEAIAARLEQSALGSDHRPDCVDSLRRLERAARLSPSSEQQARRFVLAGRKAYELGRPDVADELLGTAERIGLTAEQHSSVEALRSRFAARVTWRGTPALERCRQVSRLHRANEHEAALDLLPAIAQSLMWTTPTAEDLTAVSACLRDLTDAAGDPRHLALLAIVAPEQARRRMSNTPLADEQDAEAGRLLAVAAIATGDLPRAADLLMHTAQLLRSRGLLGLLAQVRALQGHVAIALGDWDLAATAASDGTALARRTRQPVWELRAMSVHAAVCALRGDIDQAMAEVVEVERQTCGRQLGSVLSSTRFARAMAAVAAHHWAKAFDILTPLFDPTEATFNHGAAIRIVGYLAETALHADRVDEAKALIERFRAVGVQSPLLDVNLAMVDALLTDDDAAPARYAAAHNIAQNRWPWVRARLDLAHGMWLRRHRHVALSRAPLQAALQTFEVLGAEAWCDRARAELRAAGVDLSRHGDDPVHVTASSKLSPQELEIAVLAADGLSNRQIGQRLVLSPRTVGSHLYRIFPKLDITSRAQLARRLKEA